MKAFEEKDDTLPFPNDSELQGSTIEEIKAAYHKLVKAVFDFDKIMRFCQENRVEVLFQDDQQFHCFINYTTNPNPYCIDIDAFSAMVFGIKAYLEEEKAMIEAESFKNTNK